MELKKGLITTAPASPCGTDSVRRWQSLPVMRMTTKQRRTFACSAAR
ncbi:hypothetical protein [Xanthomonas floridensis]|nr:hypothetical protein [Xanthomonas floridensis]